MLECMDNNAVYKSNAFQNAEDRLQTARTTVHERVSKMAKSMAYDWLISAKINPTWAYHYVYGGNHVCM